MGLAWYPPYVFLLEANNNFSLHGLGAPAASSFLTTTAREGQLALTGPSMSGPGGEPDDEKVEELNKLLKRTEVSIKDPMATHI